MQWSHAFSAISRVAWKLEFLWRLLAGHRRIILSLDLVWRLGLFVSCHSNLGPLSSAQLIYSKVTKHWNGVRYLNPTIKSLLRRATRRVLQTELNIYGLVLVGYETFVIQCDPTNTSPRFDLPLVPEKSEKSLRK